MAAINPYLNFNGNAEEAFNFYKSVFGGEFTTLQRFGDVPGEAPSSGEEAKKIMHIALPIGPNILMASDVPSSMPAATTGSTFTISIDTSSEEETRRIFNALSAGGQVTMPLDKMFWGAFFGMLTDKYGFQWMVSFDEPKA